MADQNPSNAPDDAPVAPREPDTAATVLSDDEARPGGGGLGGADSGDPLRSPAGGASRSSPVDTGVAPPDADVAGEAARRAVDDPAPEPRPASS